MEDTASRRPVLLLPFWVWVLVAALGGLVYVQTQFDDQGMANGFSWMIAVFAALLMLFWFCFFSGKPRHQRYEVLVGALVLAGLFAGLFKVEGMTGNMIPIITFRPWLLALVGRATEEAGAPAPVSADARADLASTTPQDFPQFLGPQRDLSVASVKLSRDWSAQPPQEVWRRKIGAGWSGFAVVNGYAVTLEQHGFEEAITCYEVETGKLVWVRPHPARYDTFIAGVGPRSTPTIHEGKVYVLGVTGVLFCLDGADGRVVWKQDLRALTGLSAERESQILHFGRANSPLIVDDLVVVPLGGPEEGSRWSLAAFNKQDGALVWKAGDRNVSYSSPALATLAGAPHILIVNEDLVSAHDPATGKVLWTIDWPGESSKDANVSQAIPLPPDRVYVSKGYATGSILLKVVPKGGGELGVSTIWRQPKNMKTKFTNVAIHEGHVYGLSDGILECQNLETGKRVWRDGRYGHGQILRVHDLLLVLSEEGELFLVEATPERPNHVLGQMQALEGRTWNNLALYGEHLLVRNGREAVCYRLSVE
jgi:outer membrane protein assembly factor BamB